MTVVDEKLLVENFSIRLMDHPNKVYAITLDKLSSKQNIDDFIHVYAAKIKALNSDVAATYFCNYYGWVLTGFQYMLSLDAYLNIVLANVELQIYYNQEHDHYGLTCKLHEASIKPIQEMKKEVLEVLYEENVTPLLQAFAQVTNVQIKDLWRQLSIGLYYGHDINLKLAESDEQKKKLESNFILLTKELAPHVFNSHKNQLNIKFRMVESAREPGVYQRMKPSCCLYYQTEGAETKCYTCPRLSDREREQRKLEIRASM